MTSGQVAFFAALALFGALWVGVAVANVARWWQLRSLEPEDAPDVRARNVWLASVAGLFLGFPIAAVTWVVIEWVLVPVDPMEDSVGSIQLLSIARTNIVFVLVASVILAICGCVAARPASDVLVFADLVWG